MLILRVQHISKQIFKMKKHIVKIAAVAVIAIGMVACKGEKKNETTAETAKEVAEATTEATKYKVDTDISLIDWLGTKPTGTHEGNIKLESGVVKVSGDKITGTFLIDMTSINVTDLEGGQKAGLESHLKGTAEGKEDHFFNVTKFPTAAFEITGIKEVDAKKFMQGNLTIKGIKKNIEFPVTYTITGDNMELTSETFTIDRTIWGINFMSESIVDDIKNGVISDDMELTISLKAKKA